MVRRGRDGRGRVVRVGVRGEGVPEDVVVWGG